MNFSTHNFPQQAERGVFDMNSMPSALDYTLGQINASSSIPPNICASPDYSNETTLVKDDPELPDINLLNHL